MKYTGTYFGVKYVDHVYEPTEATTNQLLNGFKHKFNTGDAVMFREPHKKTCSAVIEDFAYSTHKYLGGTIKVYLLNGKWISESRILNKAKK